MSEISNIRIVDASGEHLYLYKVYFTISGHEAIMEFKGPDAEERARKYAGSLKND